MARSGGRCVSMVCGIEASYIPDMLVQYPGCNNHDIVLAPGYNYNLYLAIGISGLIGKAVTLSRSAFISMRSRD